MEPSKKELALTLIDSLIATSAEDDREMVALNRKLDPHFASVGISAMQYHLPILKELVEQLKD